MSAVVKDEQQQQQQQQLEEEETTPVVVKAEEQQQQEELLVSALRDNIAKKGKNAYYFAHSNTPTGPKWDGKQEPRLLHKQQQQEASDNNTTNSSLTKSLLLSFNLKSNITSYSFMDGDKSVKLYIDKKIFVSSTTKEEQEDENKGEIYKNNDDNVLSNKKNDDTNTNDDEENNSSTNNKAPPSSSSYYLEEHEIDLQFTSDSLSLRIPTHDKCLLFSKLAGTITDVKFKLKNEYLLIILKKETPGEPWKSMTCK